MRLFWTDVEIATLNKVYPVGGVKLASEHLPGRSKNTIRNKAYELQIKSTVGRINPWSDAEKAALREYWPKGGFYASRAAIPGRTMLAMRNMAKLLGISAPHQVYCREVPPVYYSQNDAIDEAIRTTYREGKSIKALSFKLGRPRKWVSLRALNLGLRPSRGPVPRWTDDELEIVNENSGKSLGTIRLKLAANGYRRTEISIKKTLARYCIDTTPDNYTGAEFARLMGVSAQAVLNWLRKGWLTAKKDNRLSLSTGDPFRYWITPSAAREFIVSSVAHINFGKCDKYWLVDLLDGKYSGRAIKSRNEKAA